MASVKKIMITGGHVTPALAVIDSIREKKLPVEIVFVGRKYSNNRETSKTFEYKEISDRKIKFIHLKTGRLTRILSWHTFISIFEVPFGFIRAFIILLTENPDVILSFGGYIAFPIAILAKFLHKKVYTHEQTITPGLANKRIAAISDKIFISFPESQTYFPKDKVILTGNPLRKSIFVDTKKVISKKEKPCIYITGGSLGSHSINQIVEQILPELLDNYIVIHQSGNVEEFGDYERLLVLKDSLPDETKDSYILLSHVANDEIGNIYAASDIVIGRAGANTFFELIALKKPTIFIPLPWSANNEQENQATIFKDHKTGEIFHQTENPKDLVGLIAQVLQRKEEYSNNFKSLSTYVYQHAEDSIITEIFKT